MPQLPPVVWLAVAGVALLLVGLCAATAYAVLRAPTRRRVAHWPAPKLLALVGAAAVPWLVVWLAPIRVVVNIRSVGPLIGWTALALLAFALLTLLPLAALLSGAVWLAGRLRRRRLVPPAT